MSTAYCALTPESVVKRGNGPSLGMDGVPAGMAVLIDLDKVTSRAQLLELFRAAADVVMADYPFDASGCPPLAGVDPDAHVVRAPRGVSVPR